MNSFSILLIFSIGVIPLIPVLIECKLLLSPLIKQNRLSDAKTLSEVKGLPNTPDIKSYSGFITVDEKYNSNMFFWFFPSFKNPAKAPVLIWLEGGPGVSSIWSLFVINGPFKINKTLHANINPYSLNQEFNVLYIDNPVGVGFSFTDDDKGYATNQNDVSNNLYNFLQQFYQIYSEYRANQLYIVGESYGGKYVPALGYKLMQMSNQSNINFKGIAIGNGLTDPLNQLDGFTYLKSTGLIDEREQDELKKLEQQVREHIKRHEYKQATEVYEKIYVTKGPTDNEQSLAGNFTGYLNFYDFLQSRYTHETLRDWFSYIQLNQTRKALHVEDVEYLPESKQVYLKLHDDILKNMEPNFTALIAHYKVMVYAGNLDMFIGPAQINAMLENKEWKYYNEFYSAKRIVWKTQNTDTEVAGYAKYFNNFLQVIIRNATHSVGIDQPRANLDMMTRFVFDLPFDKDLSN